MEQNIQTCINKYKTQLKKGYIQSAYKELMKYMAHLLAVFPEEYKTGNISPGYLDYTYFAFFNEYLRKHKLRFGIVLNHEKMQFELWLMGQNVKVQKKYWNILKNTKWNKHRTEMPKYSVLEVVLNKVDFNDIENMSENILSLSVSKAMEIQNYLENHTSIDE